MMTEEQARLLEAAIQDDVKTFGVLLDRKNRNLCYGRFPLLSLLYLYGSRRCIAAYSAELSMETRYTVVDEPLAVYRRFARYAGKALRYWAGTDKVVTPVEMMAVMGDRSLREGWSALDKDTKKKVMAVYAHANGREAYEKGGKLVLPTRSMSRSKRLTLALVAAALVVAIVVGLGSTVIGGLAQGGWDYALSVDSQEDLVKALGRKGKYRLTQDLALPKAAIVKCDLDLNGHTLTATQGEEPLWSVFEGSISGGIIEVGGSVTVQRDYAVLVGDNRGTWTDVTVRLVDNLVLTLAEEPETDEDKALNMSVVAVRNYGEMKGMVVEGYYSQTLFGINWTTAVYLSGHQQVDGRFGAVAGVNYGKIEEALLGLYVEAADVDFGGVAFINEGEIAGCEVAGVSELSETSSAYRWSPIVGGIAATNRGLVCDCTVEGTVQGYKQNVVIPEGTDEKEYAISQASVGGIVANNYGQVDHCAFAGTVLGGGEQLTIGNVGGIVATNGSEEDGSASITRCNVVGNVQAIGFVIFLGGVVGTDYGLIERTVYAGRLNFNYNQANEAQCGKGILVGVTPYDESNQRYQGNKCLVQTVSSSESYTLPMVGRDLNAEEGTSGGLASVAGVTGYNYLQTLVLEEEYWYGKQ